MSCAFLKQPSLVGGLSYLITLKVAPSVTSDDEAAYELVNSIGSFVILIGLGFVSD